MKLLTSVGEEGLINSEEWISSSIVSASIDMLEENNIFAI